MKKKIILIIMLAMSLLIIVSVLCGCASINSRKEIFKKYQSDFENIKEFMLAEKNTDSDYETYGIIYSESGVIVNIYGISQTLSEEELASLNSIINAFKHDFSFIEVGHDRVSFGGNGNDMYVFSLNGKSPKWFYSPNDGVNFSKEKLSENWFFLYNNVR